MLTTVVDHPLARRALTTLRDQDTDRAAFRIAMDDLAGILVYEATRQLRVEPVEVTTPLAITQGVRVTEPPMAVPILRAGLGLLPGVLRYLPDCPTGFIGVARNEETLLPEPYMNSVPEDLQQRDVLVLDPMLATGGSMVYTLGLLASRGAVDITVVCVVAAPEGVAALEASAPDVRLFTASIDDGLNDIAYIVPGLGDAGDRLFGTR